VDITFEMKRKSTVLKMLSGVRKPDKGEIYIGGVKLEEHTPDAARRLGIAMIFQEMSLIPSPSVALLCLPFLRLWFDCVVCSTLAGASMPRSFDLRSISQNLRGKAPGEFP
jgi:ABC transporter